MKDSPHQKLFVPLPAPKIVLRPPREARFGDNSAAANYELNMTLLEAEADAVQRQDTANLGHERVKNTFRR